ncbi:MAG: hypothetical protein IE885_06095 [Campylobacterales bacterium]|nr:hypothetical protein [Campylobacterales bacterium]
MRDIQNTFIEKLYECQKHKEKIILASQKIEYLMPLSVDSYNLLSFEQTSFIDQMIFRFTKLQDTMGEKLFPSLLELMGEEVKSKPFIDRLNRIEELGILYKNDWMDLRKDRNEIAHEYSFNQDEVVEGINTIYRSINKLLSIYDSFYGYCTEKFDFVRDSDVLKRNL